MILKRRHLICLLFFVDNFQRYIDIARGFNHGNVGLDTYCFLIASPWLKPRAMFEMNIKEAPSFWDLLKKLEIPATIALNRNDSHNHCSFHRFSSIGNFHFLNYILSVATNSINRNKQLYCDLRTATSFSDKSQNFQFPFRK